MRALRSSAWTRKQYSPNSKPRRSFRSLRRQPTVPSSGPAGSVARRHPAAADSPAFRVGPRGLDSDYAEALWALDQHSGSLDPRAMLPDTLATLDERMQACSRFRQNLPQRSLSCLAELEVSIQKDLSPVEAYNMVPSDRPQKRLRTPRCMSAGGHAE